GGDDHFKAVEDDRQQQRDQEGHDRQQNAAREHVTEETESQTDDLADLGDDLDQPDDEVNRSKRLALQVAKRMDIDELLEIAGALCSHAEDLNGDNSHQRQTNGQVEVRRRTADKRRHHLNVRDHALADFVSVERKRRMLPEALGILKPQLVDPLLQLFFRQAADRKSTRLNSSHVKI